MFIDKVSDVIDNRIFTYTWQTIRSTIKNIQIHKKSCTIYNYIHYFLEKKKNKITQLIPNIYAL